MWQLGDRSPLKNITNADANVGNGKLKVIRRFVPILNKDFACATSFIRLNHVLKFNLFSVKNPLNGNQIVSQSVSPTSSQQLPIGLPHLGQCYCYKQQKLYLAVEDK